MTKASTVLKKINFSKNSHLNALGSKWARRPSWSCDQDHLDKLSFQCPKESPYEN